MKQTISLTASLTLGAALALAACAPADPVPQPAAASSAVPAEITALRPAGGAQVCPRPQVGADLLLTDATRQDGAFDPSTVALELDGVDVTAQASIRTNLTDPASRVSITYTPPTDLPLGQHTAALNYATPSGPATITWYFTVLDTPCGT